MNYRSNLAAPYMTGFKLLDPPMQNCWHDIPSDPDFEPGCGYWSLDEIAILYNVLHQPFMARKTVIDIGARFGWTAKAIHDATSGCVLCVDPILKYGSPEQQRFKQNLGMIFGSVIPYPKTAAQFFRDRNIDGFADGGVKRYSAFVIDGNHEDDEPLNDAKGALSIAAPDCILIFHDGRGEPIQRAVSAMLDLGMKARFYYTPNGVFVCWRGVEGWMPPDHDRDQAIDWAGVERGITGVDLGRMS